MLGVSELSPLLAPGLLQKLPVWWRFGDEELRRSPSALVHMCVLCVRKMSSTRQRPARRRMGLGCAGPVSEHPTTARCCGMLHDERSSVEACWTSSHVDEKRLRDAASLSIKKKKPWASTTTAPPPTFLSVGTVHILAAVLRCSAQPGLALRLFSAMKGMDGGCYSHLLQCLCSMPLETEVSMRHMGLGS